MDVELVQNRLQDLGEALDALDRFDVSPEKLRSDLPTRWQVEHGLQVAIQGMIDIGTHILTSDHDVRVDDYTEVVDRLEDLELIDPETAQALRPLPGLRNALVHDYADVDYELVVAALEEDLEPLRDFIRQIADLVE